MRVDFKRIKKYSKTSNNFDEKLEYLNKELKKTGLDEAMANSTSGIYVSYSGQDNQNHTNFEAITINGQGLGISGGDGNGAGGASVGTITLDMELGHAHTGTTGVALSPPHPITGKRKYAKTQTGIGGYFEPLRPGTYQGNYGGSLRGGALWFWDPNYNFGGQQGRWLNFEWMPSQEAWGWYDTSFITGSLFLNPNLDEYELNSVNLGTTIKNSIASINFGTNGEIGTPQTTVINRISLDDPGFIPIPIEGLSTQGFNYLKGKAGVNVSSSYYSPEDKKNVINYYKKKQADPNYQPKPYERESLIRQMRAQGDDGTQIASTDPSAAFSSAPPDAFEPETVETELTPADIPDEFKIGYNTNTTDESKPTEEGKKVKLTKWMSRTDYMSKYPNTSMVDYLSSLPYGPTDFMTPNPNYNNAWDLNTKGYENYFMNGDLSALGNRDGIPKPRHSTATPEPEKKGKTPEEIISDLEKLQKEITQSELEAYAEMNRIALELGMDFVSLIGGLFTGGTTAAPVMGKLGMKLLKKYGKTVAGKMIRKLLKKFRNKKNGKMLDDIADTVEKTEPSDTPPRKPFEPDKGGSYENLSKGGEAKYDKAYDKLNNERRLGGRDGDLASKFLDDLNNAAEVSDTAINNVISKIKKSSIGYLFNSYKLDKEKLLSEAAKLGLYEPEAINVDLADIRKGIMPEFPKDPPPKLIGGYSEKSRLAPVKNPSNSSAADIGKKPFIKITKKDLARNHLLTDSDIKEFMDTINKLNEYIKNNPEELIYAQERYPFHDPRLAQLNWQMDQMLDAGKDYIDKQFPENQKLFDKIKKKIKNTIDQTDPKNFKDTKLPKFDKTHLEEYKRKKEVYSRFLKKPVKIKNRFHLDMKDVKKRHLEKIAAQKLKEAENKKEKKVIQEIVKKHKSDWKKDLGENFTVVSNGPTNSATQTFQHVSGQNFSFSGLGGQETHPSTVTVFGDTVPAPNYDQLALAGYAKPLGNVLKRKEIEDTNSKLDASQEFAQKVGADVMMNARVDYEAEQEKKAAKIIYNAIKLLPRTRFNQELKVLYGYLSGEMTEKITNKFISKKHLISLFKTAGMRGDGRVQMDDFIVGSGQKLIYDPNTDTYSMKFNYDFETNAQELLNTKLPLMKRLLLPIIGGKYGYDAGIFGRMVERAKELGFGQNIEGEFTISGEDLNKINPKLIELYNTHPAYMNDMGGFDTGHGYSSPPEWLNRWASKSQFSGDLRSLWDGKTRTWNLGGKIVDNYGRSIKKPITPKPSKSKSAEKIKSMAKTKRQSLSLDEPVVRSSKKSKKKRG